MEILRRNQQDLIACREWHREEAESYREGTRDNLRHTAIARALQDEINYPCLHNMKSTIIATRTGRYIG